MNSDDGVRQKTGSTHGMPEPPANNAPDTPDELRTLLKGQTMPVGFGVRRGEGTQKVSASDWRIWDSGRVELSIEGRDDHVTVNIERELLEVQG